MKWLALLRLDSFLYWRGYNIDSTELLFQMQIAGLFWQIIIKLVKWTWELAVLEQSCTEMMCDLICELISLAFVKIRHIGMKFIHFSICSTSQICSTSSTYLRRYEMNLWTANELYERLRNCSLGRRMRYKRVSAMRDWGTAVQVDCAEQDLILEFVFVFVRVDVKFFFWDITKVSQWFI